MAPEAQLYERLHLCNPSAHRLIMALGDKELNAKSVVGKAAQLLSHLVPNLSHSLHHKALLIIRSDTFDYSVSHL